VWTARLLPTKDAWPRCNFAADENKFASFQKLPLQKKWGTLSRFDADVLRQTSPEIPHVLIGSSAGPADRRVGGMICRIHVNEQAGKALP